MNLGRVTIVAPWEREARPIPIPKIWKNGRIPKMTSSLVISKYSFLLWMKIQKWKTLVKEKLWTMKLSARQPYLIHYHAPHSHWVLGRYEPVKKMEEKEEEDLEREEELESSDTPTTCQLTELLEMTDKFKETLCEFDEVPHCLGSYLKLINK